MEHKKQLRISQTDAEIRIWSLLRGAQLGCKFRRQHELAGYIADFACLERRLIVELDGSQHLDQSDYDLARTQAFSSLGFRVLRFWNNDVLQQTEEVLASIHAVLAEPLPPHPNPLPRQRRGRGSRNVASVNSLPQASLGGERRVRGQHVRFRERLELRARLYALIRQFFAERDVLEVETPILSTAANTDPNIQSFTTRFTGHADSGARDRWLRTSSEFAQKRLLVAGIGDCYELGRVFRDGEAGRRHNPEFTMLEWYRVGWDHHRLMAEVVDLVQAALALVEKSSNLHKSTYHDLFIAALGVDPFSATQTQLQTALGNVRVDAHRLSRDDWLDLLLTHRIQPNFPSDRITVVCDYPMSQCALAKIRHDDPPVAERFEVYVGQQELANGYQELTDAAEQRARFVRDNARRCERGLPELPLDENLLVALQRGLPECSGVALGVERLLMAMIGSEDIRDVLAFPFAEA